MTFTIEQLEAMKEGTTPGPWKFQPWGAQNQNGDHAESVLMDDSGETIAYGLPNSVGETVSRIPALVDALIAEKRESQRIRTELEEVLDTVKHETWLHDDEGQFPETVQLGSYVAGQLTQILEGNA